MPPNIHQPAANSPADWYYSLPPITRVYGTVCVAATLLSVLGLLNPYNLFLSWPLVFGKLQIWRLLTCFIFLGKPSFPFLLRVLWIIQYGAQLEKVTFQFSTADFVYMLLIGMAALLALLDIFWPTFPCVNVSIVGLFAMQGVSLVMPVAFLGPPLIFMMMYVWSRNFSSGNVSIMGMVNLQAFYLPFAMLALSLIMGGDWVSELLGILAGHLYYFLKELHPAAGGGMYLETPTILKRWLLQAGIGTVPVREVPMANPSDMRFRAFQGQGRRLAE